MLHFSSTPNNIAQIRSSRNNENIEGQGFALREEVDHIPDNVCQTKTFGEQPVFIPELLPQTNENRNVVPFILVECSQPNSFGGGNS